MSSMFEKPKIPAMPPLPDEDDGRASAERLRQRLARNSGRSGTVLTKTSSTASGSRPRATLLGGGSG